MTWAEMWAFLDQYNQYPDEFRQYVEGAYDLTKILPGDLAEFSEDIQADYQDYVRAPKPYQDPVTKQWWIDEQQYTAAGKEAGVKTTKYTPPKKEISPSAAPAKNTTDEFLWNGFEWERNPWYAPAESTEALTPYQKWQMARTEAQDILSAQQSAAELAQRQQELNWNRAQQAQANVFQPQPTYVNAESTEPTNWINYWKAGQDVAKRQVAAEQRQGAINQFAANLPPSRLEQVFGSTVQPMQGIREGIDPTTGQKIAWNRPEQMNMPGVGIEDNKQMWDPLTQSYRPETEQEWMYRLAASGVGAGVLTPENAQMQSLSDFYDRSNATPLGKQEWMATQLQQLRQPTFASGPETPQWAQGVLQNPQANINLQTLGQQGNIVRPVSAQMYQGWAPSQQQGYQGLAAAQKGVYPEDYMSNVSRMWGASRPGQLARQKVPSWGY